MASTPVGTALRDIERVFGNGTVAGLSERQLLDRFADRCDDAAFEALVRRHGPMVLAVCRRLLADPNDADDAFQATFLVLARKAGSISRREPLGPWLYGVAYRVASKARVSVARRRRIEAEAASRRADRASVEAGLPTFDLGPIIWEEVHRLPSKYRDPVVLCCIEGYSHEEAASMLRWPTGTVKGRLQRARETLRGRLARRGISAPVIGLAAWLSAESASAKVPLPLLSTTVKAATAIAAGGALSAGVVPASAIALARGAIRTMTLTQISTSLAALVVSGGLAASGLGALAAQVSDRNQDHQAAGAVPRAIVTTSPDDGGSFSKTEASESDRGDRLGASGGGSIGGGPPELAVVGVLQKQAPASRRTPKKAASPASGMEGMMSDSGMEGMYGSEMMAGMGSGEPDAEAQRQARLIDATEAQQARIDAAKAYLDAVMEMHQNVGVDIGRIVEASRKYMEARLDASETRADRIDAIQEYLETLNSNLTMTQHRYQAGEISLADLAEAKLKQAEAAAMLAELQADRDEPDTSEPSTGAMGMMPGSSRVQPGAGTEGADAPGFQPGGRDPRSKAILETLNQPIPMPFEHETPLSDVLDYIRQVTATENQPSGIPIYVDPVGLEAASAALDSPVIINLDNVPLRTSLWLSLRQLDLAYTVVDGVLIISHPDSLDELLEETPIYSLSSESTPADFPDMMMMEGKAGMEHGYGMMGSGAMGMGMEGYGEMEGMDAGMGGSGEAGGMPGMEGMDAGMGGSGEAGVMPGMMGGGFR